MCKLLILTNGTLLTNSGSGVIGLNMTANSNTVKLTSANTRWFMSQDLSVGSNGSFNHLLITNGGFVANNFGALGIGQTSSNNEAVVTGSHFWLKKAIRRRAKGCGLPSKKLFRK